MDFGYSVITRMEDVRAVTVYDRKGPRLKNDAVFGGALYS
jgi:hypothetical protein